MPRTSGNRRGTDDPHPAVSLAAVIGVPHERHGEEVKAFIILREGATITEVEMVAWSKQNMAD